MTPVRRWSGREAKALRDAMRLSVRDFAERLGVNPRTVSKWESGGDGICPRPETQSILDTALVRRAVPRTERARAEMVAFQELLGTGGDAGSIDRRRDV